MECVSSLALHMPNATIGKKGWDLMRLHTMRHTSLTGDVKTGGPQRHADCVISSDEQVIQRHVGPRLSNRGYPASGNDDVAAGAAKHLRTDCVLSDDGQIADFRPTSGGLLSSERGGGAVGSAATPHRSALRRDLESVDYDMPDRLNAALSTSSRPLAAAADGSPLLTDDMLVDHDVSNPLMSLPSGDCPVPLDQPPTQKRGPKTKKKQQWYKNGHTGDQRRDFEGQGWQSRGPHPSDSSL